MVSCWTLERIGSLASILSCVITIIIAFGVFFIRRRFLDYGIEKGHSGYLEEYLMKLKERKKELLLPSKIRQDIIGSLNHIKEWHQKKIFGKHLRRSLIADIETCIVEIRSDENCTTGAIYLRLHTITETMKKNPRIDYATK